MEARAMHEDLDRPRSGLKDGQLPCNCNCGTVREDGAPEPVEKLRTSNDIALFQDING